MAIFSRPKPSGFSGRSTAEEVTQGIDGAGLTAIVTGATSGIGVETTRVLALRGVHVVTAVRNAEAGSKVKEAILKDIPTANIDVMELDLSSLASVRKFAAEYISSGLPLNLLINNAGVMTMDFLLSKDNIELHFATNYLGHYLLTNLLLETMKRTAQQSNREGRIVNVTSKGHRMTYHGGIRFNKINSKQGYNGICAYGQSKLANILHAYELSRRLKDDGVDITANSVHPGVIATKLLSPYKILSGITKVVGKLFFKSLQQGAATTCYVALHPQLKGVTGKYFADNKIANSSSLSKDAELAKKLWDYSLNLIKST